MHLHFNNINSVLYSLTVGFVANIYIILTRTDCRIISVVVDTVYTVAGYKKLCCIFSWKKITQ